jgi:MFS family permease
VLHRQPTAATSTNTKPTRSRRSILALDGANFFQAESVGVVLPVLAGYLKQMGWRFDAIGVATAIGGLGTLIFQTPAGWVTDRVNARRALFAVACVVSGICYSLLPLFPHSFWWVNTQLFLSGIAGAFFAPVLAALALSLVGHGGMPKLMGENQALNHAGNIVSALLAILLVAKLGISSLFYSVGVGSFLAAISVLYIRSSELDPFLATGRTHHPPDGIAIRKFLADRTTRVLFVSVALFHFANAPILPAVAMYVKKLGGTDQWMTATVLTAQAVMIPAALIAGRYARTRGRKWIMGIAFWVLPLRILSYVFVHSPKALVGLQSLDGIGAGIYGVVIALFCADLSEEKGGFNTLMGLFATALAVGGVVGPLCTGVLIQHFGFRVTFLLFALLATVGALWFTGMMPETLRSDAPLEQILPVKSETPLAG